MWLFCPRVLYRGRERVYSSVFPPEYSNIQLNSITQHSTSSTARHFIFVCFAVSDNPCYSVSCTSLAGAVLPIYIYICYIRTRCGQNASQTTDLEELFCFPLGCRPTTGTKTPRYKGAFARLANLAPRKGSSLFSKRSPIYGFRPIPSGRQVRR